MSGAGKCPVCRRAECRLIQTGRCADAVRDQRDRAEIRVIELEQELRCAALNLDSAAAHLHDCDMADDASALHTSAAAARRVLDGSAGPASDEFKQATRRRGADSAPSGAELHIPIGGGTVITRQQIVNPGTISVAAPPPPLLCPNCQASVGPRLAHWDDDLGCWQCRKRRA